MKQTLIGLAAVVSLTIAMPALAHDAVYIADLSGMAEDPPNDSLGTGFARVTINDEAYTVRIQASFSGLTGTTTIAHIHCCTAAALTATAGVAVHQGTLLGFPAGVKAGSYDNTFDMTLASSYGNGFFSANDSSAVTAFATLASGLASGKAYFNIHSNYKGPGEIRGFLQLAPVPEPQTYALMLAGLGVLGWAARRQQQRA